MNVSARKETETRMEGRQIAAELRSVLDGEPWHGPALFHALAGVTAEGAAARGLAGAHTIWELVLHLTGWADVVRRRIDGQTVAEPELGDFPAAGAVSAEAWSQALERLRDAHERLCRCLERLDDAALDRRLPGRKDNVRFNARGVLHHVVYHAGQISLLKKAGASA